MSTALKTFLDHLDNFIVQCEDIASDHDGHNAEIAGYYRRLANDGTQLYATSEGATLIQ